MKQKKDEPMLTNGDKRKELTQALRQEIDARVKACGQDIQKILDKHGCTLETKPGFRPNGTVYADVFIAPKRDGA